MGSSPALTYPTGACAYDGSDPFNCPLKALPWANNFTYTDVSYVGTPVKESIEGVGPLPCGIYTADWMELVHRVVGKFVIYLRPDQSTEAKIVAYARQPVSFFIHGDSFEHPGAISERMHCASTKRSAPVVE
jgi:hypothetical protein